MLQCIMAICSFFCCGVRLCIPIGSIGSIGSCFPSVWECCVLAICYNKVKSCLASTGDTITDGCKSVGATITDCCDSITHHNDTDHIELTGNISHEV